MTGILVATLLSLSVSASLTAGASGQQVADTSFKPAIAAPAYAPSKGPVVLLDEAHFNFHTAEGRYLPFAELLRRDGYVVRGSREPFTARSLGEGRILVVANALAERNHRDNNWSLPTPSAFTDAEVGAVVEWVKGGGSLLLIADHMPFPGAAEKLAAAFGVRFSNGFATERGRGAGPLVFRRSDASLRDHAITRGRSAGEAVDAVTTFTGSAFRVGAGARPLLVFGPSAVSLEPAVAWDFKPDTPRVAVGGWCQGAALRFGRGRVAVFGEAAMFTAQLAGPNRNPMGMNSPTAARNYQLLLNTLHWLSGLLGD